jgi:hypothetical protein
MLRAEHGEYLVMAAVTQRAVHLDYEQRKAWAEAEAGLVAARLGPLFAQMLRAMRI